METSGSPSVRTVNGSGQWIHSIREYSPVEQDPQPTIGDRSRKTTVLLRRYLTGRVVAQPEKHPAKRLIHWEFPTMRTDLRRSNTSSSVKIVGVFLLLFEVRPLAFGDLLSYMGRASFQLRPTSRLHH